ncbi:M42 family metallopeptidase [soil metagenome]
MNNYEVVEQLSNAFGPSGFEDEVTGIIRGLVEPFVDDVRLDALGNLLVTRSGNSDRTIMLDAHMDEIGFMISYIEDNGFLRFSAIGGWDARIIPSHRMTIQSDNGSDIHGVVGTLPPHLLSAEDRSKPHKIEDLFLDIGAANADEVSELGIRIGSPAVIHYPFQQLQGDMVTGKALDDRGGCAVLIATLAALADETPEMTVVGAFTVREEVGLIGAGTAAFQIQPDLALVLEATIGADMPGVSKQRQVTRLGGGPAITVADGSQIVKPELVKFLTDTADELEIPWHYKLPPFGGTDGGSIQRSRGGVRSASVSIPCRYIHSPFSVMRMSDFEHTVELTTAFARRGHGLLPA